MLKSLFFVFRNYDFGNSVQLLVLPKFEVSFAANRDSNVAVKSNFGVNSGFYFSGVQFDSGFGSNFVVNSN